MLGHGISGLLPATASSRSAIIVACCALAALDTGCGEAPTLSIGWLCDAPQPALSCNAVPVPLLLGTEELECCFTEYSDCPLLSVSPVPGAGRLFEGIEADGLLCYPPELPGLEGKCGQSCWYLEQQRLRDGG